MLSFVAIILGFMMLCGVLIGLYLDFRGKILEALARLEGLAAETQSDLETKTTQALVALDKMADTAQLAGTPLDVVRDMGNLGKRIASLPLDAVEKGLGKR